MQKIVPPAFEKTSFNCPHCNAFSHQIWKETSFYNNGYQDIPRQKIAFCTHCNHFSIWLDKKIIYPETTGNKISISGTYALEQGYDYIYIYDGAGTTTTPIQTLSGSGTLSTITSTASNGALTIKLYADNYTDDTGFAFDIA